MSNNVLCINCKYFIEAGSPIDSSYNYNWDSHCGYTMQAITKKNDMVNGGKIIKYVKKDYRKLNKNNNCKYYEKRTIAYYLPQIIIGLILLFSICIIVFICGGTC